MANKNIVIPIIDSECTSKYFVEYKLSSDISYNSFFWYDNQIPINNLADASTYNVRITRYCCNGSSSEVLTLDVDTTTDSTVLDTPTGLALGSTSTEVSADCGAVTDATTYLWNIAQDPSFTVYAQTFENGTNTYTFTGLTSGTTYYVRVKARASGYADSAWSSTESIATT